MSDHYPSDPVESRLCDINETLLRIDSRLAALLHALDEAGHLKAHIADLQRVADTHVTIFGEQKAMSVYTVKATIDQDWNLVSVPPLPDLKAHDERRRAWSESARKAGGIEIIHADGTTTFQMPSHYVKQHDDPPTRWQQFTRWVATL